MKEEENTANKKGLQFEIIKSKKRLMGKIFCPDLNLTTDVDDDCCEGVKMREGPVVVMVMVMMTMMMTIMSSTGIFENTQILIYTMVFRPI